MPDPTPLADTAGGAAATALVAAVLQRSPRIAELAKTDPTLYAAILGGATAAAMALVRSLHGHEVPLTPGPPVNTPLLNTGFRLP